MKARSKKEREKRKEILLEGKKLIIDALKANGVMKSLYFSGKEVLENFPAELVKCPVYKITYKDLKLWTDTETPQGLLAIFEMPNEGETTVPRTKELPVTLICDEIRDPGNMGTLIRTAAAVGCQKVITTFGSVDVWDSKVLRSGAGGHFRVPIINNVSWSYISNYVPNNPSVFIADNRRPSDWVLDHITKPDEEHNSEILNPEINEEFLEEDEKTEMTVDKSFLKKDMLEMYKKAPLNVSLYSEVDFTSQGHTVLVIGGEAHGLSIYSRKFAFEKYGQCVMIPMAEGVNSLNSSIAGSIVLYEIHKQYSEKIENNENLVEENSN